ncbi:hypothetical protein ACHAXR_007749 [Thalassiosira sp. AJA248-18]
MRPRPSPLVPAAILLFSVAIIDRCNSLLLSPLRRHVHIHHNRQLVIKTPKEFCPQFSPLFTTTSTTTPSRLEQNDRIFTIGSNDTNNDNIEEPVKELGCSFAQKLSELEEYQRKNGHCLVPKRYEINPSLGNWVNKQRQNYRKYVKGEKTSMNEKLNQMVIKYQMKNQKRISALNQIGFVWKTSTLPAKSAYNDNAWRRMYNELSQFHANNGHCRVPSSSSLGQWVVRQRFLYRQQPMGQPKSSFTRERIRLLDELDFPWMTRSEQLWKIRINELREFKRQHKHCMVPRTYPTNPQLSSWVATQRKNYNRRQKGKASPLTVGRIKELEEMGFVWSHWDHNFFEVQLSEASQGFPALY